MTSPFLELKDVSRHYADGEAVIRALDKVSLTIESGEFIAIMGQSGSGKSTLMNILGCLDSPTSGAYRILGQDAAAVTPDALAALRRETFGFIFQRYNLLSTSTAAENVEIPAVYAGLPRHARIEKAKALLARLGLGDRAGHRPSQLSGGQQQRVAIARALVNDPPVILADEPTGALDSASGAEVMRLLRTLHEEGRTIILITHDAGVAANAQRIVQIKDGKITSDTLSSPSTPVSPLSSPLPPHFTGGEGGVRGAATPGASLEGQPLPQHPPHPTLSPHVRRAHEGRGEKGKGGEREKNADLLTTLSESTRTALRALRVNIFRTALTLLGIVIGVAAVVTMLAVGTGSKQKVLDQISAMGTNLLNVRPGAPNIRASGDVATLVLSDAKEIEALPNVALANPERSGRMTLRYGNTDYATSVQGAGPALPAARDWPVARGAFFTDRDMNAYAAVAVLGQTVANTLFPGTDPIGQYVLVRNIPFLVIGVMAPKGAAPWGGDQDDTVFVPLTTGLIRLFGQNYLGGITVKVHDVGQIEQTEEAIKNLLLARHKTEDFRIRNMASILDTATETQNTLTLMLGTVAAISLLVGGIGVMNIMLVSVTERTREIGLRMATGARRRDILLQFNTESAVVCTIGGLLGVAIGLLTGKILSLFGVNVIFSVLPAALAFGCAFGTGILFGFLPARKAAWMDPVAALASE